MNNIDPDQTDTEGDKGPVTHKILSVKMSYFLTRQFKHSFWVLKRTVSMSLRRFFCVPTAYVLAEK